MKRATIRGLVIVAAAIVGWAECNPCCAWFWSKNVKVWVDDAHTSKIKVPKLDVDKIAKETALNLSLSVSHGGIGVGVKYSRESGVKYDAKAKELIARLKQLGNDFNRGKLSLGTYRRRLREIYAAEEKARRVRDSVFMLNRQQAYKAFVEMDKVLGIPAQDIEHSKKSIGSILADLMASAAAVQIKASLPPRTLTVPASSKAVWQQMTQQQQQAIATDLDEFDHCVTRPYTRPDTGELIEIWKDDAHSRRIKVPKLDVKGLVRNIEDSLTLGAKFYCFDVGPKAKWTLRKAREYDETAQNLIVKYRQLCMEYNADLVSQESYNRRLAELYAAEENARHARYQVFRLMRQQAKEGFADLDKQLDKQGVGRSRAMNDLDNMADKMSKKAFQDDKGRDKTPSMVKKMSQQNQDRIAAASLEAFQQSVANVKVKVKGETVQVWVDDAKTRKVTVPKLDPELLARSLKQRLALHISYYGFGPELAWARKSGVKYDEAAQLLIVKYKQLCMDYNAGLVSQESYQRRRKEIDAAAERAAKVREEMFVFQRKLAKEAFAELDRQADLFKELRPK